MTMNAALRVDEEGYPFTIEQDEILAAMFHGRWNEQVPVLGYHRRTVGTLVLRGMLEYTYLDYNGQPVNLAKFKRTRLLDRDARQVHRLTAAGLRYLVRTGRVAA